MQGNGFLRIAGIGERLKGKKNKSTMLLVSSKAKFWQQK